MFFSKLFGRSHGAGPSHVIGFDDLRRELAAGVVDLVDVREQGEYRNGHVPGSRNVPLSRFDPAHLPRDRKVVLICLSGARSGTALRHLRKAGFENAVHFQGGVSMWRTLGGPLRA
ncbi:MAG TPA: rhodanese-like domain-containing protein [Rhodoblastus sp.]|nr:rhodanese-like domain-containing protein [Rhodoblastus sp.]